MNTWLQLRNVSWPAIELSIVVFAIIAAWRHKSKGLWILAAASVLGVICDAVRLFLSSQFLYQHPNAMSYLTWIGVGFYAAMVIALCGWVVLAFTNKRHEKPDV
jgi:hypothetical protein